MSKNAIIKGTFILTATGFLTRFIGFFFRSFLSHTFGEEQMGLYQLIFPIYALCFSLSSAGIETALSRCVAQKISLGKKKEADNILYQALLISLSLSLLLVFFMRKYATFLSIYVLGDLRCEELLRTLAFGLPFSSIHNCICGYYLGQKKTKIPALAQLIEQLMRVGAVYVVYRITQNNHTQTSIWIAVLGLVIGEIVSAIYCVRYFSSRPHLRPAPSIIYQNRYLSRELLSLAVPLTSSRILMNLLQSIESISIPLCLQKYGYTNSEALSTYGVLTGMALPCILFPTAVTNSVSTMLLPTVAEIQAEDDLLRLKGLIRRVIFFGFGLGTVCGISFLLLGSFVGRILFDSTLAGDFMRTLAWICPFMYMNTTLLSILNGLGKANSSFVNNVCGLAVRISGVWIGIGMFGMNGYLWGLLISQLLVSLLCVSQLGLYIEKRELY